jgi:hypothetical protein
LNSIKGSAIPTGPITAQFSDDFEGTWPGNWTATGTWKSDTAYSHSATHSAYSDRGTTGCHYLTLTNFLNVPAGLPATLSFWKRIDSMSGWNGGKVEASGDGTTWTKLTVDPPYNGTKTFDQAPCMTANETCFTGSGTTWIQHTANIPEFPSGNVKIRFTWGVNWPSTLNNYGWWVDDVQVSWGSQCQTQGPGAVPGKVLNNLLVSKSGSNIVLNWQAPGGTCTLTGYGVYRGSLPWSGYNHTPLSCTVPLSNTTYTDVNPTSSYYYLVVPQNSDVNKEGSHGLDSNNNERQQGPSPCKTQDLTPCN